MIKSILTVSAIILSSVSSAFAGPASRLNSVDTPYGQTVCMQRAKNQLFIMGATSITSNNVGIWGHIGDSVIGVWCRGAEAIIVVAGNNNSVLDGLRDEVKGVF
jgi:hypothetical protein